MNLLITGAAGNLGSHLARHLLATSHRLHLMVHRTKLPAHLAAAPSAVAVRADLGDPTTLEAACGGVDCIVHFAGKLFAPRPERFLGVTNLGYVQNLSQAAKTAGVRQFILISFPHVEGETTPERRATGTLDATPSSAHARTRLAAEQFLCSECASGPMRAVVLRAGMIYGRDVKMVEAARRLMKRRLLAVWDTPTWTHLLALPDFLAAVQKTIEQPSAEGIYQLADDEPITLQDLLDRAADHLGYRRPWRLPRWTFHAAAGSCEALATVFGTISPLTRDFIRIGMASSVADTSRMKNDLGIKLAYPTWRQGLSLL